jgi:hypothetical protein
MDAISVHTTWADRWRHASKYTIRVMVKLGNPLCCPESPAAARARQACSCNMSGMTAEDIILKIKFSVGLK